MGDSAGKCGESHNEDTCANGCFEFVSQDRSQNQNPMMIPQITDCMARFLADTPCIASLVVITGLTMNLIPNRKVIKTEKLPMVADGTRLDI